MTLQSTCTKESSASESIFECNFQIQNETQSALSGYRVIIDSSKEISDVNFLSCTPTDLPQLNSTIVSETKGKNETTCAYRIGMSPFEVITFNLKISGNKTKPNPVIIQ
mgnify:FL=1